MENARKSKETVEELFFKFMDAQDCPEITSTFRELVKLLEIKAENPREFYSLLKGKLQSWRCKSLWELLDSRANQKEYGKGKICEDIHVLVIGAGPIGLRTAIEVALLGAKVVIVEKRESFVRNNVLHLWPFLLTDFRSLGAKKFYGKFCSGSIDHISIRRLQAVLLKTALIFGAKVYTGVTFDHVIEPNSLEDGWKCKVSPESHPVSKYEFDVLIGADGKKNVIPGFQQIEMRGTLAIGITANFVNHCTEEEANVEEISGIAYQFNPQFFDELHEQKGIKLENIVYYKDETHYFVMTAGKASLLKRGALKEDLGAPAKLLAPSNIDHSKLLEYVTDVVKYATKGTLRNLELKKVGNNQPDIAAFDFTSIKKAEHAARIIERKGSKLLVALVGDSLLEPFWPTGSGCARGVLSALDAAWTIRSFAQDKPPLQILSERENIYRLLSGTSAENLHKDHAKYTINPSSRYLHITHKRIREVYHLFDTDDPVNADFSVGSPQTEVLNKASRRKRISTGAKFTSTKGRKRGRASSHLAADIAASRMRSTSGSSTENLASHKPLSSTRSVPLDSKVRANTLSSVGSDDDVFQSKTRRVRLQASASPVTGRSRSSTVGSSGDELKGKRRKTARKRTLSKDNLESPKENTRRKKGFFGFGKSKPRRKTAEDSDHHSDKDNKLFKDQHEKSESKIGNGVTLKSEQQRKEGNTNFVRDDSWKKRPAGSFSREQYTRRSTRDIIREMEARSKGEAIANENTRNEKISVTPADTEVQEKLENGQTNKEGEKNRKNKTDNREMEEKTKSKKEDQKKKQKEEEKKRKEEERKKKDEEKRKHEEEKKRKEEEDKRRKKKEDEVKKREQANNLHNKRATQSKPQTTPPNKKSKKQSLLEEVAALSPSARRAMPVLSTLSPVLENEDSEKVPEHTVTSAVRDAAMLLLATPLLVDGMMPKKGLNREGSWLGKSSGRVRDVVNRYNTLNNMKPLIDKMNEDATPLKRPRDSVDGYEGKPRKIDNGNEGDNENESAYTAEAVKDSFEVKPTPPSEKKKTLQMKRDEKHLHSSPSLERLKFKLQDFQDDPSGTDKDTSSSNGQVIKDFSSPIWQKTVIAKVAGNDGKTNEEEPVKISKRKEEDSGDGKSTTGSVSTPGSEQGVKDFTSPMWQKTAIAFVAENNAENKENSKEAVSISTKNEEVTERQPLKTKPSQGRRRSSVLPSELMEEKLTNLLNSTTAQRARESIKYMIFIFKQIQKHPNDEKYYRIFKERVKFRKQVWTVRNAKLFMTSSGWTEIGSFVIFPLSKQIEGPLLLLNKYLSMAEEKSIDENSNPSKADHQKLRKASSTDLAERIMELKEALVSSKTNSYKTNKFSDNLKNRESKILHRAVSMDEVNILRRTNRETSSAQREDSTDSKYEFQKPRIRHLDKEKETAPAHLRRSVSENALHGSSENHDELTPAFSPFTRRFSQRGVKEQEISCELVMENPLNLETVPISRKHSQGSFSSSDEEEIPTQTALISVPHERQAVRSPQEAVLEEADQLSSVLGNLIGTLGSSTNSERESEPEKEVKKKPQNGKVKVKARDQHKDEELEALCETLDLLIHDNSSDSSSESAKENFPGKKPYNRQTENRKSSFKPPLPSTKRTTQQLGKTKSLDHFENSKRSSMANGRLNRDRVSKAKSVDVAQLASNRRPRERTTDTRQNISKRSQRNTTDRPESSTRAQRQKEANISHGLDTTNRIEMAPNKRDSGAKASHRTEKRPALKVRSVDLERSKARPPVSKSKSVDHQGNGPRGTRRSQVKKGSRRSSSSEDDKKPQRLRIADQTRMKTRAQSSGRAGNRASLAKKSKRSGGRSSTEEDIDTEPFKPRRENTTKKGATARNSSPEENPVASNGVNSVNIAKSVTCAEKASSDQVIREKDVTNSCSDAVINIKTEIAEEVVKEDVNLEYVNQENETLLAEADRTDDVPAENSEEIIKLSKEIQFHYSENEVQSKDEVIGERKETDKQDYAPKVKQWFPSDSELRDLVQDGSEPLAVQQNFHEEMDSHIKENGNPSITDTANSEGTQSQPDSRKMTLLDIGKQQSKDRLKRKEVVSFSLEERKQQILDAAVTKPKSKPADKRRSILQIKSRSDGNLVKNKKEAFEKPKVAYTSSDSSVAKTSKQRHFRFRGRKKKSFELSSEPLEVVAEDHEEVFEETPATNGKIPSNQANGVKAIGGQTEEKVGKEKGHSPVKLSPFQLRFTKRRASYDLE